MFFWGTEFRRLADMQMNEPASHCLPDGYTIDRL